MKPIVLFLSSVVLLQLGNNAAEASIRPALFASQKHNNHGQRHLDHRNHEAARNPDPAPGATHSTERLEEPGRKRNYGTEYTKEKRRPENDSTQDQDEKGRAWTYGKVPRW